ncbi:MAG: putative ABC transport system permease protein [Candidatus Azotimanducaceae bacterium]|jgi:putative ABC transport system permease protein
MIKNYILIAWRQLFKNKLYASINVLGLVTGLSVYIFGSLLVEYENGHDSFYKNFDRIYTIGSIFSPNSNIGVSQNPGIYTGFTPFIEAEMQEIDAIARTVNREFLMTIEDNNYYQDIRFTDPSLLQIFDFQYLEGNDGALMEPEGVLLSESTAIKLFGAEPALGKLITLDHKTTLHVTAVIKDLPRNTHFNSALIGGAEFEVLAPLTALNKAADWDLAGNFGNLSSGNLTYIMIPASKTLPWLQAKMDGIWERHLSAEDKEFITGLRALPLAAANTFVWDMVGLPMMESIELLAILVLLIAIVNYTNLATAQSLRRAREVGLRKTLGAERKQLLFQFITEGLVITFISMFIALAILELVVPSFNAFSEKALSINYATTLPWLILTTFIVGSVAGAYPAFLVTKVKPIDALNDKGSSGSKGSLFRSIMLGLQFSISIFILASVLIVYFQNKKVQDAGEIYPRSQIITLQRLSVESIQDRLGSLKNELLQIRGVTHVSFSSDLPYRQNNSSFTAGSDAGNKETSFPLKQLSISEDFFNTYDIPIKDGRGLSKDYTADIFLKDMSAINVVINELAAEKLGYSSSFEALGKTFYDFPDEREARVYKIVGVVPTQNFNGFHNAVKATVFYMRPSSFDDASIRVSHKNLSETLREVTRVWDRVITDYPIQTTFLDEVFGEMFDIFDSIMKLLGVFAAIALTLSLIGLFGLAAFMAESRTREIGIRKVMGANTIQIVTLLIFQFSKPVMWALLIALPGAYFASEQYLNFFADRITIQAGIVGVAGLTAVLFSWLIVAIHAVKIARANPIEALRYE